MTHNLVKLSAFGCLIMMVSVLPSCRKRDIDTGADANTKPAALLTGRMSLVNSAIGTLQVLTQAGGDPGFVNSTGTAAKFNSPGSIAADTAGNLYVADRNNNMIRKITIDGVVTTFAGSTTPGFTNGKGAVAAFRSPTGVAIDAAGNLYVADSGNNVIRKIVPAADGTGDVSTLAGTGDAGFTEDGPAAAAQFNGPSSVAVDASGANVYVTDALNVRVRKISGGFVFALAGNGQTGNNSDPSPIPGRVASFNAPTGIAVDNVGTIYLADKGNNRIRKITQDGVVSPVTGDLNGTAGNMNGSLTVATFNAPAGIAIDAAGTLYVADKSNNRIRKIILSANGTGTVSTLAGTTAGFQDGLPAVAQFKSPAGVAVDVMGNICVADQGNHRVRVIRPVATVSTAAGDIVHGPGWYDAPVNQALFYGPNGVATDAAGNVYVADQLNHAIRKITTAGNVITLAGNSTYGYSEGTGFWATFYAPSALAVDGSGNVYVSDQYNNRIRKITPAGTSSTLAGNGITGLVEGPGNVAEFNSPGGIGLDAAGNVYVADVGNHRIRKITPAGVVSTLAGSSIGYANGAALQAKFNLPFGLALDGNGNVYVSEEGNNRIRKITPAGIVTTLAGSGVFGFANGAGTLAKFNGPQGIAADAIGNVYVADMQNNMIRQVNPAGIVTTFAGSGNDGWGDGLATQAYFHWPMGVALSASGSLYVADYFNNLVRKIQ